MGCRGEPQVDQTEGAVAQFDASLRRHLVLIGVLQLQVVDLVLEVVRPATALCLRIVPGKDADTAEGRGGLQVEAAAVLFEHDIASLRLGDGLLQVVGPIGREHPLHLVLAETAAQVAVEGDGGVHNVVVVSRGEALAAALHLGAVDRGIGQCDVGLEVAQRVADDAVLLVALDAEEPDLVLAPLDVVILLVALRVVVVDPYALAVHDLIGIAFEEEGIAVAGLQSHAGEVEGRTTVFAEADTVLHGHDVGSLVGVLINRDRVLVQDLVHVRGPRGGAVQQPLFLAVDVARLHDDVAL